MGRRGTIEGQSRIQKSGQITLPKKIQKFLKVKVGEFVEFGITNDKYVIIRKKKKVDL